MLLLVTLVCAACAPGSSGSATPAAGSAAQATSAQPTSSVAPVGQAGPLASPAAQASPAVSPAAQASPAVSPAAQASPAASPAAQASPAASPVALASPAAGVVALPTPNGPPIAVTAIWTAVSGASGPLWTAYEEGYFKQAGLDMTLTHIPSTSRAIAALLANEAQFTNTDPQTMVQANAAGADLRLILGMENRLVFSIMTQQSINSPEDLRGKTLGITRAGSSTDTAARQALKLWGLQPDKDVSLLQLSEVPSILAGLQSKQIDAGVVSPPTSIQAQDAGFKVLIDLAKDGPNYPSVGVSARQSLIQSNPETVRRFVRGYAAGLHTFMTDKQSAEKDMNKYLELSDQNELDQTWQAFSQYLADPPEVPEDGMQTVIDDTAQVEPKVAGTKPSDYLDMSFVRELEPTGIFNK
jgi:NitT/TauT family transport system substrate-binding protein